MEVREILEKFGLPLHYTKYIAEDGKRENKLLAAKGLLPADRKTILSICYILIGNRDEEIAGCARETLLSFPVSMIIEAIDETIHPKILEFYAFQRFQDDELAKKIVNMIQVNDATLCLLAEKGSIEVVYEIVDNQEKLLMVPEILHHLKRNPIAGRDIIDRVMMFQRLFGVLKEGAEPGAGEEEEEGPIPEGPVPPAPAPHPPRVEDGVEDGEEEERPHEEGEGTGIPGIFRDLKFNFSFESPEDRFERDLIEDKEDLSDEDKKSLQMKILRKTVGDRIKLAYIGNREARRYLVRDSNKLVATAVIKSPKLTESEVVLVVQDRNVCDEVLRLIGQNKEWLKRYNIKVALVNNPKTPLSISLNLLNYLLPKDLQALARNRNVPSVLFTTATKLLKAKRLK